MYIFTCTPCIYFQVYKVTDWYYSLNHFQISNFFHADNEDSSNTDPEDECYEYELIGVTVHTGNAEGGHYYSFIKERNQPGKDKW